MERRYNFTKTRCRSIISRFISIFIFKKPRLCVSLKGGTTILYPVMTRRQIAHVAKIIKKDVTKAAK